MNYVLYGSLTSPFLRRIRMLLENIPYELVEVDVYNSQEKEKYTSINPIHKIPTLQIGEDKIWDSRQIFNYLNLMHKMQNMDWNDENILTAMEEAMNSSVSLMQLKRSGLDLNQPLMIIDRQNERIESILTYLKPYIRQTATKEWNFHSMTLYSYLDWALFRELLSLDKYPECKDFLNAHSDKNIVKLTAIPKDLK